MGKGATAAERRHLERVANVGCIVCRREGNGIVEANVHHIRLGQGMAQRASHFLTIPLCHAHHQTGGHGVAIHAGQSTFERIYGSEAELLAATLKILFD